VAWQFIERRPLLGRGFGTFLPEYWILDNQYLLTLVEMGFVGLVAVLVLIGTALYCVGRACRLLPQGSDHDLAVALMASNIARAARLALFDKLSYPHSTGVFFLLLGLAGAYWRLARSGVRDMVPRAAGIVPGPVSGRSDG
jgi:O-antigen ligase